jgi:uracil-DNA glycosylase
MFIIRTVVLCRDPHVLAIHRVGRDTAMAWQQVVNRIAGVVLPGCFNPFSDRDEEHDLPDGMEIRRQNLRKYLEAMERLKPRIAFVAEAPGYRGMRRTGISLSSEVLLPEIAELLGTEFQKATRTKAMSEITARVVWEVIEEIEEPVLLWNAVMIQPTAEDGYHNRTPRKKEILAFQDILQEILSAFEPEIIFAVGRTAERALRMLGIDAIYVRHPAHGGAEKFRGTIRRILP